MNTTNKTISRGKKRKKKKVEKEALAFARFGESVYGLVFKE